MSRTTKSIKNSCIALIMYFINLILQFFSRKIFLDYLGTEILGLNTTATNLLQFLNLAELGIGAAIGFTLYKPIYDKDTESIKEILTIQGWYYKKIAYFVLVGSGILMLFFPRIFSKISLPLWYAYASYGVILFSAILSYFFNYRQVLLSADQKDYKIQYSYKLINLLKLLTQAFAIKYLPYPYIIWLSLEFIFAIMATYGLSKTIKRTYPFLTKSKLNIIELKKKHSHLIKKIGQVFYHKIGGFALTQSSPLIIYAYANLTVVTLYGNYALMISALSSLLSAVFNSMGGGIGNLVASHNKDRILSVFNELFALRYIIITTLCIAFWILSSSVITYWIGSKYLLTNTTVLIILLIFFINTNRSTVDNFLAAYGLYGDIYSPLIEASINIGLSILLGYYWGLNGILMGVLISLLVVIFCWKPYYLFKNGFKISMKSYFIMITKNLLTSMISISIIYLINRQYEFTYVTDFHEFCIYTSYVICYFTLCITFQMILNTGLRDFVVRIYRLSKIKNM